MKRLNVFFVILILLTLAGCRTMEGNGSFAGAGTYPEDTSITGEETVLATQTNTEMAGGFEVIRIPVSNFPVSTPAQAALDLKQDASTAATDAELAAAIAAVPGSTITADDTDPTKAAQAVLADTATEATTAQSVTPTKTENVAGMGKRYEKSGTSTDGVYHLGTDALTGGQYAIKDAPTAPSTSTTQVRALTYTGTETMPDGTTLVHTYQESYVDQGSGSFSFDAFPAYEDSAHSSGFAVNGTTLAVYSPAASKWLTASLTDTLDPAPVTYTLTISPPSNGDVTCDDSDLSTPIDCPDVNCTATFASGASITGITATPDSGYTFTAWTGDHTGSTSPYDPGVLTDDLDLGATFAAASACASGTYDFAWTGEGDTTLTACLDSGASTITGTQSGGTITTGGDPAVYYTITANSQYIAWADGIDYTAGTIWMYIRFNTSSPAASTPFFEAVYNGSNRLYALLATTGRVKVVHQGTSTVNETSSSVGDIVSGGWQWVGFTWSTTSGLYQQVGTGGWYGTATACTAWEGADDDITIGQNTLSYPHSETIDISEIYYVPSFQADNAWD